MLANHRPPTAPILIIQVKGSPNQLQQPFPECLLVSDSYIIIILHVDGTSYDKHLFRCVPMVVPEREDSDVGSAAPLGSPVSLGQCKPPDTPSDRARTLPRTTNHIYSEVSSQPPQTRNGSEVNSQHTYESLQDIAAAPESLEDSWAPSDVPSYQFVTELDPYARYHPSLAPEPNSPVTVELEEIPSLEERTNHAMYARVSKRIKCPTPPPIPPPEDVDEVEEEELAPPLPERPLENKDS